MPKVVSKSADGSLCFPRISVSAGDNRAAGIATEMRATGKYDDVSDEVWCEACRRRERKFVDSRIGAHNRK